MAGEAPLAKYVWRYVTVLIFLFVLARFYAYAITYDIVPDFPDPVLKFLARINDQMDTTLDPISHVVGPLVFGIMLKVYSPKFENRRKGAPKDGNPDVRVTMFDGKKQLVIVAARMVQCGIFIGRECLPATIGGAREVVCMGDCSRRVFDIVVSGALAWAELKGWDWDGGLIEKTLVSFWKATGKDAEEEVKPEEEKEDVVVAGPKRKIKR